MTTRALLSLMQQVESIRQQLEDLISGEAPDGAPHTALFDAMQDAAEVGVVPEHPALREAHGETARLREMAHGRAKELAAHADDLCRQGDALRQASDIWQKMALEPGTRF